MTTTTTPTAPPSTAEAADAARRAAALVLGETTTATGGIALQDLAGRVGPGISFSDVVRITDALHTIGALARWNYSGRVFVRRLVAEGRKGR